MKQFECELCVFAICQATASLCRQVAGKPQTKREEEEEEEEKGAEEEEQIKERKGLVVSVLRGIRHPIVSLSPSNPPLYSQHS